MSKAHDMGGRLDSRRIDIMSSDVKFKADWEKEVFGQYLFASAFFWEDIVSFFVIAIHTAYLLALILNLLSAEQLMWLALVAYSAYFINALQFLYYYY